MHCVRANTTSCYCLRMSVVDVDIVMMSDLV